MRSRGTAKLAVVVTLTLAMLPASVIEARGQGNPPKAASPADTAEIHLARGHEALKQNRYQEAAREFRAALEAIRTNTASVSLAARSQLNDCARCRPRRRSSVRCAA